MSAVAMMLGTQKGDHSIISFVDCTVYRVFQENMFLEKRDGSTHSVSVWGLL